MGIGADLQGAARRLTRRQTSLQDLLVGGSCLFPRIEGDHRDAASHPGTAEPFNIADRARRQKKPACQSSEGQSIHSVYQPIVDLHKGRIVGFECLTRFQNTPYRSPDKWFGDAAEVGLGVALELQTFKAALRECAALPASAFIALNVSPEAIASGWISAVLKVVNPTRVVLELTEHAPVADYDALNGMLNPLRQRGVRIAIDDVGAGYANLQHILEMRPDILKLDVSLTKDIDICPARATLMGGLVQFARTLGSEVLAEGVETPDQLAALRALGLDMAQGYLFGKPEEASRYGVRQ